MTPTPALARLLRAALRRQRLADAAALTTRVALPLGLVVAALAVAAARRLGAPPELAALAAAPLALVLLYALLRPRSPRAAARRLDAHYRLDGRLGGALELAAAPPSPDPRTAAIVALVIADAEALAPRLDPRPAAPLRPAPLRAHDLAAAALLALALLLPPPAPPGADAPPAPPADAAAAIAPRPRPAVDRALLEPLQRDLRALQEKEDAAGRLAAAVLEVLDAYGRGELDREAAYARVEALEGALAEAEAALEASLDQDPALLADGVAALAAALEQESITRPAGEDLARGEGERAAAALDRAGDEAAADPSAADALDRALQAAAKALGKAASEQGDAAAALAEAERRLKKQEQEQAKRPSDDPEDDERRLQKQRDRVEELRRQHEREKAAQRALDQLRRDAQDAQRQPGQQGQRGQPQGGPQQGRGEGQQRALERLSRGAADASQRSQQQRRLGQARDDLEDAKTFLRRSGQKGDGKDPRQRQMERFGQAAKGERGKDGKKGPTLLVEGDVGDGPPDLMMQGDPGQQGQPGPGQDSDGDGDGDGQGDPSGASPALADGQGSGAQDPLGDPTRRQVNLRDVKVDPREGRGASRAEVIATASQEGFASAAYRDVFTDYRAFAQSALDREEVPAGQRRQVRRYFQLIQPRR